MFFPCHSMFNDILPKFGIEVRFVDGSDPKNFVDAADDKTRAFFCESVSNPALHVFDLEQIAEGAHSLGLPLICDSTFSTPYLCKPFDFGVDIICTSATKWIGGHGACLGGIIVDKGTFNWGAGKHPLYDEPDTSYGGEAGLRWGHDLPESLAPLAYKLRCYTVPLRNLGGCLSPDNAWIILQGIETLSLRMERHCENALAVAEYLKDHPKVRVFSLLGRRCTFGASFIVANILFCLLLRSSGFATLDFLMIRNTKRHKNI